MHGRFSDDGGTLHCSGARATGRGQIFSGGREADTPWQKETDGPIL